MTRIRQKNVTAAQWSPNGESIGAPDLTQLDNHSFGVNVFSPAEQKKRLQPEVYEQPPGDARAGRGPRPLARRRGRRGDEGVGAGAAARPTTPTRSSR